MPVLLLVPISLPRCAKDQTVSFLNVSAGKSGRNGESSTIHFSFDMFRFTAEPRHFYLHCTIQLCEPEDHMSCTPVSSSYVINCSFKRLYDIRLTVRLDHLKICRPMSKMFVCFCFLHRTVIQSVREKR